MWASARVSLLSGRACLESWEEESEDWHGWIGHGEGETHGQPDQCSPSPPALLLQQVS